MSRLEQIIAAVVLLIQLAALVIPSIQIFRGKPFIGQWLRCWLYLIGAMVFVMLILPPILMAVFTHFEGYPNQHEMLKHHPQFWNMFPEMTGLPLVVIMGWAGAALYLIPAALTRWAFLAARELLGRPRG